MSQQIATCLRSKRLQTDCATRPPDRTAFWSRELLHRIKQMSAWQETGLTPICKTKLRTIADECDTLVNDMDFGFLFHRRKKVMSVGFDVDTQRLEPSSYDLLASESRIASFVAMAKGDVPQEAWFHLGRRHTLGIGTKDPRVLDRHDV